MIKTINDSQLALWQIFSFSWWWVYRFGVIRYCKVRSQYRLGGAVVLLAIAIFGKGLLPVAVIGLVAVVSAVQVVQDLYQSRPTTRLVDPQI
ncbi:low temperature requirement A [Nostoc commune NIES-4072]|uniref:Low temperature requirement A n=1 Tax=Nostoc commune NIES-4072 TaxID=2005467 RepID=A0A2R5FJW2_NOSCO|nr:low temperature requirement A [Nostoc commune HK-02]GBG19062.1 low temperature requirement A [Nostoc commune NIES-4072]